MPSQLVRNILKLYKSKQDKKKALNKVGLTLRKKQLVKLHLLHRRFFQCYVLPHWLALHFLKNKRLISPLKRRIPYTLPRTLFFKFVLSTRWLLREPYRVKKNPQLRMVDIRRYTAYQKLFAYGYMVAGARSFFRHRDINQGKYTNNALFIKYNHVLNDISKFKTWNLKGFCMRPIYMKRLMGLYFGEAHKLAQKRITQVQRTKTHKLQLFFNLFQYSILALTYRAFRLLGTVRLLHYIKSGYLYKNGLVTKNPFSSCIPGDVIQLNLFSLFVEPWGPDTFKAMPKYHEVLKIKQKTAWYIIRAAHLTLILSYFRNFLLKRPFRRKRYSKMIYNNFFSLRRREFFNVLRLLNDFLYQMPIFYPKARRKRSFGGWPALSSLSVVRGKQLSELTTFFVKYHKRAVTSVDSFSRAIQPYNSLKGYLVMCAWVSLGGIPESDGKDYFLIERAADNLLRTGLRKLTRLELAEATQSQAQKKSRRAKKQLTKRSISFRSLKTFKLRVLKKWRDYLSKTGPYIPHQPTEALSLFIWTTYTIDRFFKLKRWIITEQAEPEAREVFVGTAVREGENFLQTVWRQASGDVPKFSLRPQPKKPVVTKIAPKETIIKHSQIIKVLRQRVSNITTDQKIAKSQKSWWRWQHKLTKETVAVDEDVAALCLVSRHVHIKGRRSFLNKAGIRFLLSFSH